MSLKEELMRVDNELLAKALDFVANALNDAEVIRAASKEVGITTAEGNAIAQFFAELSMNETASVTNVDELAKVARDIKASMPQLS